MCNVSSLCMVLTYVILATRSCAPHTKSIVDVYVDGGNALQDRFVWSMGQVVGEDARSKS